MRSSGKVLWYVFWHYMCSVNVRCFWCYQYILGSYIILIHSLVISCIISQIFELRYVAHTDLDVKDKILTKFCPHEAYIVLKEIDN